MQDCLLKSFLSIHQLNSASAVSPMLSSLAFSLEGRGRALTSNLDFVFKFPEQLQFRLLTRDLQTNSENQNFSVPCLTTNSNVGLNLKGRTHRLAFQIVTIFHQTGNNHLILSTVSQIKCVHYNESLYRVYLH